MSSVSQKNTASMATALMLPPTSMVVDEDVENDPTLEDNHLNRLTPDSMLLSSPTASRVARQMPLGDISTMHRNNSNIRTNTNGESMATSRLYSKNDQCDNTVHASITSAIRSKPSHCLLPMPIVESSNSGHITTAAATTTTATTTATSTSTNGNRRGRWSFEEDNKLREYVSRTVRIGLVLPLKCQDAVHYNVNVVGTKWLIIIWIILYGPLIDQICHDNHRIYHHYCQCQRNTIVQIHRQQHQVNWHLLLLPPLLLHRLDQLFPRLHRQLIDYLAYIVMLVRMAIVIVLLNGADSNSNSNSSNGLPVMNWPYLLKQVLLYQQDYLDEPMNFLPLNWLKCGLVVLLVD
ncbi:hypothetical protein BDF19DRAFT_47531 [Syncephalis fuscata]|nr:hypothetical protein BDF19DRAFT_47531 [Syncephalis fuscata]